MRNLICFLLLLSIYHGANARLYTNSEVNSYQDFDTSLVKLKFVQEFMEATSPDVFISINQQKSSNPLNLESNYMYLMEYIETQPTTVKNQSLINQLKSYESQAMKMHDEGDLHVPVFNIKARAQGVENYWSYLEVKKSVSEDLNFDYLSTLDKIELILSEHHEAKTSALKKSIYSINDNTKKQLSTHFINNTDKIAGLEKFVTDFAVITKDKTLLDYLVVNISGRASEYLMRQILDNFNSTYAIEKLIQQLLSDNSSRFSMSLLKPFVNTDAKVQQFVIQSLINDKLASAAAFSLSGLNDNNALIKLQDKYLSSQSVLEKNNILLALKLNTHKTAQTALKQLKAEK